MRHPQHHKKAIGGACHTSKVVCDVPDKYARLELELSSSRYDVCISPCASLCIYP